MGVFLLDNFGAPTPAAGLMARIVFDLDGTLIDSAPDIQGVANGVLASHGAGISLAETREFIGNGVDVFVTRMRAAKDLPDALHADFVAEFKRGYLTAFSLTQVYAGVVEALETLEQAGHSIGICTNKPLAPCNAVLDHLDLTRFFRTIVGGDTLSVSKPDPAPLNAAFDALGDGPRIYAGDSEVDAETAQRAGVPFLLFSEGYRKTPVAAIPHDTAFSSYAALPALIDGLLIQAG